MGNAEKPAPRFCRQARARPRLRLWLALHLCHGAGREERHGGRPLWKNARGGPWENALPAGAIPPYANWGNQLCRKQLWYCAQLASPALRRVVWCGGKTSQSLSCCGRFVCFLRRASHFYRIRYAGLVLRRGRQDSAFPCGQLFLRGRAYGAFSGGRGGQISQNTDDLSRWPVD